MIAVFARATVPVQKKTEMSQRSRVATFARKFLPKSVKRFMLLNLFGLRRRYVHLRAHPSRLFLEREVLPWLAEHYDRVLFVGTAPYTCHFEKLFRRTREQYTTIDSNAGTAVWGARQHIVAPLQEVCHHRPKAYFDCIVLNGIFGFGIDELSDQRETIRILHDALAPGGLLLVGWNTNLHPDLESMGLFDLYFAPAGNAPNGGIPWPHRTRFALPETHVYDFYTRLRGTSA